MVEWSTRFSTRMWEVADAFFPAMRGEMNRAQEVITILDALPKTEVILEQTLDYPSLPVDQPEITVPRITFSGIKYNISTFKLYLVDLPDPAAEITYQLFLMGSLLKTGVFTDGIDIMDGIPIPFATGAFYHSLELRFLLPVREDEIVPTITARVVLETFDTPDELKGEITNMCFPWQNVMTEGLADEVLRFGCGAGVLQFHYSDFCKNPTF